MTGLDQPTLDNTSANPATRRLISTRTALIKSGAYLGDQAKSYNNQGIWRRIDRESRFVTKDSAAAVDAAQSAHTSSPSKASAPPELDNNDLEPFVFSTIVLVDRDDCWLAPDGNWKSTNSAKFQDLKLSFFGTSPPITLLDGQLNQDFVQAMENAKKLTKDVAVVDAVNKNFLVRSQSNNDTFKFRHVLFEVSNFFFIDYLH